MCDNGLFIRYNSADFSRANEAVNMKEKKATKLMCNEVDSDYNFCITVMSRKICI